LAPRPNRRRPGGIPLLGSGSPGPCQWRFDTGFHKHLASRLLFTYAVPEGPGAWAAPAHRFPAASPWASTHPSTSARCVMAHTATPSVFGLQAESAATGRRLSLAAIAMGAASTPRWATPL